MGTSNPGVNWIMMSVPEHCLWVIDIAIMKHLLLYLSWGTDIF